MSTVIFLDFANKKRQTELEARTILKEIKVRKNTEFSGPLASAILSAKPAAYVTEFDFSCYDFISNRFGNAQPTGGVIFKTNFVKSKKTHTYFLDAYGRGCTTNSSLNPYKKDLVEKGMWNRPMPFPVDVVSVYKDLVRLKAKHGADLKVELGLKSEAVPWMDCRYGITKELIKMLVSLEVNHVINTGSDLIAHADYVCELHPSFSKVVMRIPHISEEEMRILEPGAPSIKRRNKAYDELKSRGHNVSIQRKPEWKKA